MDYINISTILRKGYWLMINKQGSADIWSAHIAHP